eukprot:1301362-Ditylum_brightwellii.AAC.1
MIITKMVAFSVIWLNAFAPKSGISSTYSPRTIVCGTNLAYKNHCKIPFDAYAQMHKDNSPTNSMNDRTIGAIALGPSFNLQGGYKFMSLETGKLIHRRKFTELPMPENVIKQVERRAEQEEQD